MLVTIGSAASSGGLLQIRIGPVPAMPAGYVGNPIVTVKGAITTPTVRGVELGEHRCHRTRWIESHGRFPSTHRTDRTHGAAIASRCHANAVEHADSWRGHGLVRR